MRQLLTAVTPRFGRWRVATAVAPILVVLLTPASAHSGTITLAWDASSTPDLVAGYVVYYGTSSGNYTLSVDAGTATSVVVTNLTDGVRYYFVVRARNSVGALSGPSNEIDGIPVPSPNQPPLITDPGDRTVKEGAFTLPISASDPDGNPLTYSATGLPGGLAINPSTGVISGTVTPGSSTIMVTVSDGMAQASMSFVLTVTANRAPTLAAPGDQSNDNDDIVSLQLTASDADGDTLTFSSTGLPTGLVLNPGTGLITGTPTSLGPHSVVVTVSDGVASAARSLTWTVSEVPPTPPLSHWKFDTDSGTSAVDSTGGRTGTLTNGAGWTAGHSGNGVLLDGVNDYVAVPTFDVTGSSLTIAAWIRNTGFPTGVTQRFLSKASGTTEASTYWMLGHATSGSNQRLRFRLRTGTTTTTLTASSGNLPLNTWYYAVATYDGATMRLYLNGVQVGSIAKTGAVATSAAVPVSIGRSPEGSNYASGALDDVRIYNRALGATEINAIMNEPVNRAPVVTNPGNRTVAPGPFSLAISASDPDGDTLTYSATGLPGGTAINASTGDITGTIAPGSYSITVTASDGQAQGSATFTVTVVAQFTDDPLVPGVHSMRAIHITELRQRIDALRAARGLPAVIWMDPVIVAGVTQVRVAHITAMRTALNGVYSAQGRAAPVYVDPSLTPGMPIKAAHISELRAAVLAAEQ